MSRLIVLDSTPVWLLCKAPGRPETSRCRAWLNDLDASGDCFAVPGVIRYEVRRELFLRKASGALDRLDRLHDSLIRLPIDAEVMDIAAELWAEVRRVGQPTAGGESLDADAILAAQAVVAKAEWGEVLVATGNVQHLERFPGVDARDWGSIV